MRVTSDEMLLRTDTRLTCPDCGHEFSLREGFAKKALETLGEESRAALAAVRVNEREQAEKRARELVAERDEAHRRSLAEVRAISEKALRPQLEAMQAQLAEKDARLATLRDEQLQLRREREKLQDLQAAQALEVQKQVEQRMAERETVVRTQELEKARLREADLVQMIEGLKVTISDLQRKADQGSQQSQGEVLELEIEQGLLRQFPLDVIEEVKKGQRGGDVIQRVMTRAGQAAGVVLWEMKRAKDFSPAWTAKLKDDMRGCDAHVGVLVTMATALPREWPAGQQFGLAEGVWVCTWGVALQLAEVLRASLLDVQKQRIISAGKGEKMEAVYDYVTSPQFAQKLRAVYDTFQKLRDELESERNTTQQRWARREKQLQAGVASLLGIGGDVQGLAQLSGSTLELQSESAPSDGGG